ncbi:hypothetical protein G9A89_016078 [Geosiphon pyriformis]|nr:hypothetical protein G9A89_016078 [Geosiphon pyriformis]
MLNALGKAKFFLTLDLKSKYWQVKMDPKNQPKTAFTTYSQQLDLTNNYYPVESVFNFYINEKITDFLGRPVNIESARKNFYTELI